MSIDQHESFKAPLVALSYGIAFLGAYLAMALCEQLRVSIMEDKSVNGKHVAISHRKSHLMYLFLMSICLGGVGIWGMHFIGMHAFELRDDSKTKVKIMYNVPLMATSFLSVFITTFAGLLISCYDPMFSKTKAEIMEEFIHKTKRLSLREIRKITANQILFVIATKELGTLILGGVVMGGGICIAHYIGMMSLVFDGHIIWKPGFVVGSVLVAVVASVLAFWIVFRLLSIFPEQEILRLGSSTLMAMGTTGMHYIGMLAAHYRFSKNLNQTIHDNVLQDHVPEKNAFEDILIASLILMWAMAIFIMWHSRYVILRQGKIIRQADAILYKIAEETVTSNSLSSSSGSGHGQPYAIRNMVEQYVTKRCRAYALQRRPQVSIAEGSITLEKEQQRNMSFLEYAAHLLLLLGTCHWRKLWQAILMETDSSVGGSLQGSSQHSDLSEDENATGAVADAQNALEEGNLLNDGDNPTTRQNTTGRDGNDKKTVAGGGGGGAAKIDRDREISAREMMGMAEMLWTTRKSHNSNSESNAAAAALSLRHNKSQRRILTASGPATLTTAVTTSSTSTTSTTTPSSAAAMSNVPPATTSNAADANAASVNEAGVVLVQSEDTAGATFPATVAAVKESILPVSPSPPLLVATTQQQE